mgnify:CR=1 FL=1
MKTNGVIFAIKIRNAELFACPIMMVHGTGVGATGICGDAFAFKSTEAAKTFVKRNVAAYPMLENVEYIRIIEHKPEYDNA